MLQAFVSLKQHQPPRTESGLKAFFEGIAEAVYSPPSMFCTNVSTSEESFNISTLVEACLHPKCKWALLRSEKPYFWQATVLMPDKNGHAAIFFYLEDAQHELAPLDKILDFSKNLFKALNPDIVRLGDDEVREKLRSRHGLSLMPGIGRVDWVQLVHPDIYGRLYNTSELEAAPAYTVEILPEKVLFLRVYGDPQDAENQESMSLANMIPAFLAGIGSISDPARERDTVRQIEKLWTRSLKTAERAAKALASPKKSGTGKKKKKRRTSRRKSSETGESQKTSRSKVSSSKSLRKPKVKLEAIEPIIPDMAAVAASSRPTIEVPHSDSDAIVAAIQQPVVEPDPIFAPEPDLIFAPEPDPIFAPEPDPIFAPEPDPIFAPEPDPIFAPEPDPIFASEPDPIFASEPDPIFASDPDSIFAPDPDPIFAPDPDPIFAPDPDPIFAPDPDPIFASDPDPIFAPDPDPIFASDPDPIFAPEPDPVFVPEPDPVFVPEPDPVFVPEPDPVFVPEPDLVFAPESAPETTPEPVVALEVTPKPEPVVEPTPIPDPSTQDVVTALGSMDLDEINLDTSGLSKISQTDISVPLYKCKNTGEPNSDAYIAFDAENSDYKVLDKEDDFAWFLQAAGVSISKENQDQAVKMLKTYHRSYLQILNTLADVSGDAAKDTRLQDYESRIRAPHIDQSKQDTNQIHLWAFNSRSSSLEELIIEQYEAWPITMLAKRHLSDLKAPAKKEEASKPEKETPKASTPTTTPPKSSTPSKEEKGSSMGMIIGVVILIIIIVIAVISMK